MTTKPSKSSTTTTDKTASEPVSRRAYKLNDVCRDYDVSRSTLYRLDAAGRIKIIKIGGASRILEEDLVKLEKGGA